MYRTRCKYYPDYVNPITGRRGRYLVFKSDFILDGWVIRRPLADKRPSLGVNRLTITTVDRKRPGCVINPTKELKAANAAGLRLR